MIARPGLTLRESAGIFLAYAAFSAVWGWPFVTMVGAALSSPDALAGGSLPVLHFDLYPTWWLAAHASGLWDLHAASTAWPLGEPIPRPDSFVLLGLGTVLPPGLLLALLAWLGPAVNAWAAHRAVGGRWAAVAGLGYGFSGIAGTALLEGHLYHLLNPWIPLVWWAGTQPRALRGGLWMGVGLSLALLTSAYAGVSAALVALLFPRRWLGAGLVFLPVVGYYAWLFRAGGTWTDAGPQPDLFFRQGAQTVAGLLGDTTAADFANHSLAAPVTFLSVAAVVAAPRVLGRRWLPVVLLAAACLVGTLGREIALAPGQPLLSYSLPVPEELWFFRFPIRLSWTWSFLSGVLAARVLEAWAPSRLVLVLFAADVLLATHLPLRAGAQSPAVPAVYEAAPPGAVLDLFPRPLDGSAGEIEPWTRGWGCWYQAHHRRPILEVCLGTGIRSPREVAERWLYRALDAPDPSDAPDARRRVAATLGDLGVGSVVMHGAGYRTGDRAWLAEALTRAFGPPRATDGDVTLHAVPPGDTRAWRAAWAEVSGGAR